MRPENSPPGRKRPSFIEAARRSQIIEAATQTVAEFGYAHATLARIAARAEISKSVISYHFAGKDELLEQLVRQFFEDAWAHMEAQLATATTAAGRIRTWIRAEVAYFGAHRTGFLAMAEIVGSHRRPDGSRPFAGAEEEEIDGLAEILDQGQATGEFRPFDSRMVATIITQSVEGLLGRWAMNEQTDLDAQSEALVEFVDHAIRAEHP
ncbi:TetR family transcriptional regulator [Phytoactinopolyspora alkaliphila]|uniref:TetR family transcriptional regulator n=1 Tax=Phytoactinopolyspora alkaliphila TaxID=1783498 RepID=A0A6N9YMZ2_9ACTN|nr:TetR family transcriptional regulator [Phytoactinopolyspora alkaliphila]